MPDALPSAPASYALREGEAHVWTVPLAFCEADAGPMRALLSNDEQERAARFVFEKDRARFVSCRGSLRILLGRYMGVAPEKLAFRYEEHGKPVLTGAGGLQFNVSHSSGLAAIAISRCGAIGVDIEFIDAGFSCGDVARGVFTPEELRDFDALPAGSQPDFFFQLWTLKEALLKAVGSGFSVDPRAICIRLDANSILSAPPGFLPASLQRFHFQSGYAAAVAALGNNPKLSFFAF